jgi:hypothetical protein
MVLEHFSVPNFFNDLRRLVLLFDVLVPSHRVRMRGLDRRSNRSQRTDSRRLNLVLNILSNKLDFIALLSAGGKIGDSIGLIPGLGLRQYYEIKT